MWTLKLIKPSIHIKGKQKFPASLIALIHSRCKVSWFYYIIFIIVLVIKRRFKAKLQSISENAIAKLPQGKNKKGTDKGESKITAAVKGQPQEEIKSFFGFDYSYNTDTDDETKYHTNKNKRFYKMSAKEREAHIMNLWRSCKNQAYVCAIVINQFQSISTKLSYFGRQMIGYD